MYKGKSFLAVIPARGGSKGILRKNIRKINGKPLIAWTIEEAKNSSYLDRIIVSTDDEEIANISREYGAEVPYIRPKSLAQDESKIIDAVLWTIDRLKDDGLEYDYLVLLQPTQPLRRHFHIDEAIEKTIDEKANSLVSISKVNEHPVLMKKIKDGRLENIFGNSSDIQRQEFQEVYKINGLIYINKIASLNERTAFNDNETPYITENKYDLDIDEREDLELFKHILEKEVANE